MTDPTAEAVKAAYNEDGVHLACTCPDCKCKATPPMVKAALAAFTAAQLVGAEETERELHEMARERLSDEDIEICIPPEFALKAASTIAALRAAVENKEQSICALEDEITAMRADLDVAFARCAELEEGLRPFATESEAYEDAPDKLRLFSRNEDGDMDETNLSLGDLRHAALFLTKGKQDD